MRALFTDPGMLFAHVGAPDRLSYPLRVLAPLALLPLLAPAGLLVALPPLALNVLSEFPTAVNLDSHYLTPALPPLVWAAVIGGDRVLQRLSPTAPWKRVAPAAVLCVAACASNVWVGGLPWSHDFVARDFRPGRDTTARSRVLAVIPKGASVQAPDPLLPHLIERTGVFRAPPPERSAELVVLDVKHRRTFAHREDLLRTVQEPNVRRWLSRTDHQLVLAVRDLLVLRRGQPPRAGIGSRYLLGQAPPGRGQRLAACLELRHAVLEPLAVTFELAAQAACPGDLALRLGAGDKPRRVDLLFDGLLSPVHLRAGDRVRSRHPLTPAEREEIDREGLYVGALRSSGARPEPGDPISVKARLGR
jgi:hypothetical protein